jgi:hypothetical protein
VIRSNPRYAPVGLPTVPLRELRCANGKFPHVNASSTGRTWFAFHSDYLTNNTIVRFVTKSPEWFTNDEKKIVSAWRGLKKRPRDGTLASTIAGTSESLVGTYVVSLRCGHRKFSVQCEPFIINSAGIFEVRIHIRPAEVRTFVDAASAVP